MLPGLAFSRRLAAARRRSIDPAEPAAVLDDVARGRRRPTARACRRPRRAPRQSAVSPRTGPTRSANASASRRFGVLWNQLRSPLLLLLVFAAGLSVVTGEWIDAVIMLAIVVASVGIGYTREYRAQSAAEELRARVQVHASVLRDGQPRAGADHEVVPGDVVMLSAGSIVPADVLLLEAADCFVNEVSADRRELPGAQAPGHRSRTTPRWPGATTACTSARTCAAATRAASSCAPGGATEFGAIAHRLTLRPPETEFDRGIRHFGYLLTSAMTVMVAGRARGQPAARPSAGRDAAVLHRARRRPEPRTAAGDPQHQPRSRRERHGRAWRARAAAERDREPGQHGRAVHGQDRHADRRRGEAARGLGDSTARLRQGCWNLRPSMPRCSQGWSIRWTRRSSRRIDPQTERSRRWPRFRTTSSASA